MNIIEMLKKYNVIDLTHLMELDMPVWPTHPRFFQNEVESWDKNEDSYLNQLSFGEHTGTHVDAPVHFIKGGKSIADIDALHLISHAVKIDMSYIPPAQTIGIEQIKIWEEKHQPIKENDIVIFYTGYQHRWAKRPNDKEFLRDWPGLSRDVAQYLANRKIKAVGTDAMTVDAYIHDNYPAHDIFLNKEILIIENLNNIDKLPDNFIFIALPLKIANGSASPIRAVALY
jgi:arylformamidase